MGIEGLNRFHWMIIGCVLGVAIAFAWILSQEPQGEGDQLAFETDVAQKDPQGTDPLIKNIVIHPSEVDYQGKTKTLVSYKHLAKDKKTGQIGWLDRHFVADVPFRPMRRERTAVAAASDPNLTIESYLTELAKLPNADFIKFSYGWWYVPSRAILAGAIGGVLLIGGLWPTLLHLMIGAGFGRRITVEEKKRIIEEKAQRKANSLWRYKSKSASAPSGPTGKPVITDADRAELQAVADAYEQNVGANAIESAGTAKGAAQATAQEVQKLDAAPLQEAAKQGADDEIEVKHHEYYPTIARHHKDEKKPDGGKKSG